MWHSNCSIKTEMIKDIVKKKKRHSFLEILQTYLQSSVLYPVRNSTRFVKLSLVLHLSLVLLVFRSSSDVVSYVPLLLLMNGQAKFLNIT